VQEHQREQPERLRFVRHQHREQLRQPDRLVAELVADGLAAGARRIALVEDEVEHGQHGAQSLGEKVVGRDPEGDPGVADLPFRADEPLCHCRLGDEERMRDLRRRQAGDLRSVRATRDSAASAGWQHVKTSASRSSGSGSVVLVAGWACSRASSSALRANTWSRRMRFDRPVADQPVMTQAPGFAGSASRGQRSSAAREGVLHRVLGDLDVARTRCERCDRHGPIPPERTRPTSVVNAR
jgi:hypothetical protein